MLKSFQSTSKELMQLVWLGTLLATVVWVLLAGVVVFRPVRDRAGESGRDRVRRERRVALRVMVGLAVVLTNVLCVVVTIAALFMVLDGRMELTTRDVAGTCLGPVFTGTFGWITLRVLLDKY